MCSILLMLANIIIFSNELWWLSVALLNSARLLGMSGYQNHFPREFPTDQKCLWGLPELLHFQDVILFFFPQGLYPWERRWHWGRKAGFCSQLCAYLCSVWPWRSGFASVQQGKRKGSGCNQRCWGVEMATEPCHRKPSSLLQPANVPVLCCSRTNTGRKKWNSTLRTQNVFTRWNCYTLPLREQKYSVAQTLSNP